MEGTSEALLNLLLKLNPHDIKHCGTQETLNHLTPNKVLDGCDQSQLNEYGSMCGGDFR